MATIKSIEEKAKRYDEAITRGSRLWESDMITRENYEYIFPEVKEREDERIRKAIYNCVKWFGFDSCFFKDVSQEECLAWLEKQGEQKPADTEKGTNGNERKTSIPEPPLTIKHAKEVMGIKQDYAWSEEDEKCIENAIMYCKWARDIAPNLHCYEISEKSINWLKSLKERYTWKPSDEQMETLENVRKILHTNDIYSKANNLMYNFEELIRTLKKLMEK